jgi:prevent-host-death family protein
MAHNEHQLNARVGVRELRQNLSVYLQRVKEGQSLDVTEHGRRVARLVPAAQQESRWERLLAEHRITPGRGSLAELGSPPLGPPGKSATEILREMRDEERW